MNLSVVLTPDLKKRKEILKEIAKTNKKWNMYMTIVFLLFICSIAILLSIALLLIKHPTTPMGIFVFICFGFIIACIPFFIAISTKNKAKYYCPFPYSSYANASLFLNEDRLEYVFWRVGPREPAAYSSPRAVYRDESKFVYSIERDSIKELRIDDAGICRIKGKAKLTLPEWAKLENSELKEMENNFSFITAFSENNAKKTIIEWRENNG